MSLSMPVISTNFFAVSPGSFEELHKHYAGHSYSIGESLMNGIGNCIEKIKDFIAGFCSGVLEGTFTYSKIFLENFYKGMGLAFGLLTGFILFMEIFRRCTSP